MNDEELNRYSRHILLPQIDYEGQLKLLSAHALIFGAGGLGCPIAMFLGASGVGNLTICDPDSIDLSNLQRQIGFTAKDIGSNKAKTLAQSVLRLNPSLNLKALETIPDEDHLSALINQTDIVIDATDNFDARFWINKLCVRAKKPLVSGAAIKMVGHVFVFRPGLNQCPCYHCLYPADSIETTPTCEESGVFAPLVGIIGSIQAAEVLKLLLSLDQTLAGRLLQIDIESWSWRNIEIKRDPKCTVCRVN